jgi:hypothetical protein
MKITGSLKLDLSKRAALWQMQVPHAFGWLRTDPFEGSKKD